MAEEKPISFIDRRLIWLEDFKTTVEPIDSRIRWAQDGIKSYGLLLVRNMFVLNAGALVAVPAYATAIKDKSQLLGVLVWPISLYVVGLVFANFSGVSAYYNFNRGMEYGLIERNFEAHKLNNFHFPVEEGQLLEDRKKALDLLETALKEANKRILKWYWLAHRFGWCCFICFVSGSIIFMWRLAS
jgi:hypothetical protein